MNTNTKNLKPFDLQAALKGEPVMLRSGEKAYIRHHETELLVENGYQITGFIMREGVESVLESWDTRGRFYGREQDDENDIIGMYPKTRIINGFEVPAPETIAPKIGDVYYIPRICSDYFVENRIWAECSFDLCALKRGLVFLTKEDAIANSKAMLGIDPYPKKKQ